MTHYRYEREYPLPLFNGNKHTIKLIEFETVRDTPKGCFIRIWPLKEKFVLKEGNKKYAYPTKKEAFDSFAIRTLKSKQHALRDVKNAKTFIELIKKHELNTVLK